MLQQKYLKAKLMPNYATSSDIRCTWFDTNYENMPIQIYWKFHHQKLKIFRQKTDIFHISAHNVDCGYSLEPPQRGDSYEYPQSMFWAELRKIMYNPVNPSFSI